MKVRLHHRNALALCCLGVTLAFAAPSASLGGQSSSTQDAQNGSDKHDGQDKQEGRDPDDPADAPPDIGAQTVPGPAAARSGKQPRREVGRAAAAPDKPDTRAQRRVTGAVSHSEKAKRIGS